MARASDSYEATEGKQMGKVIISIVSLIAGFIGGAVVGGSALTGMATGAGVATGLSAGICATVTAAAEEGLLSDEEIGQVLSRAATDMGGEVSSEESLVGSRQDCVDVMVRLREASTN
jgi:hypothetical protein